MVIGAGKAGTTTLHSLLGTLSAVYMSSPKEVRYFSHPRHPDYPLEWYYRYFAPGRNHRHRGESAPQYTMYPVIRGVAPRIHEMNPDIRLVYLVRDPVDRLVSAYAHNRYSGYETRTIEQALTADATYLAPSMYGMQLGEYLRFFSIDQVHVEDLDSVRTDPMGVLHRLADFLDVQCDGHPVGVQNASRRRVLRPAYRALMARLRTRELERTRWQRRIQRSWVASKPLDPSELRLSRELDNDLRNFFVDDTLLLEDLVKRSFADWRRTRV
jgi:hypothetical protein